MSLGDWRNNRYCEILGVDYEIFIKIYQNADIQGQGDWYIPISRWWSSPDVLSLKLATLSMGEESL